MSPPTLLLPAANPQGPDGEGSRSESGGIEFHHTTFWAWSETDGACEALTFAMVDVFVTFLPYHMYLGMTGRHITARVPSQRHRFILHQKAILQCYHLRSQGQCRDNAQMMLYGGRWSAKRLLFFLSNYLTQNTIPSYMRSVVLVRQETIEEALQGKGEEESERSNADAFQLDRHTKIAMKMLSLDPNLAKIHARLISHMSEKTFWYNYFSRIAALREEVNLEPLCEDFSKVSSRQSVLGLVRVTQRMPLFLGLFAPTYDTSKLKTREAARFLSVSVASLECFWGRVHEGIGGRWFK